MRGADAPPVHLELGLAGAPGADPAAEAARGLAPIPASRGKRYELRQLHLELALFGPGPLGEDVEDQLGPVDAP